MKVSRVLVAGTVAACLLLTTTAFAYASKSQGSEPRKGSYKSEDYFTTDKDIISMLESKKEHILELVKGGGITQEEANERIAKIDQKINKIKEFNSLNLEEKKAALLKDFKERTDQMVKDGKITQVQADEKLKSFNEKLAGWDGKGYPRFGVKEGKGKGISGDKGKLEDHKDPLKMLDDQRARVQQMLKDGRLTQEEANVKLKKIDDKISEINKFNLLTLEQKKEVLMKNFKDNLNQGVKDGKITQKKADEMLKNFTDKLTKWDGKGYPGFMFKGTKDGLGHQGHGKGKK